MESIKNKYQRSDEVVHIIEHMPNKFGFVVSGLVLLLIMAMFSFGFLIQYPDVLKGQATITNRQAPIKLVSISNGRIDLFIEKGQNVIKGQYLGAIKNAANIQDVKKMDSLLTQIDIHHIDYSLHRHFFPDNFSLGELTEGYFLFLNSLYQYLDYHKENSFEKEQDILEKQLKVQGKLLESAKINSENELQKYDLNIGFYRRDSILFSQKVISAQELEQRKLSMANSRQQYQVLEKDQINYRYQAQEIQNKLALLSVQRTDKEHALEINMYNKYYALCEAIRLWEHKYVFASPIEGKVELLNFWKEDDYVEAGKDMFSIIPASDSIKGQVLLPDAGAGKVRIGQEVIIKLDDFPFEQFGSVRGKVIEKSIVTTETIASGNQKINTYLIVVSFPNGLATNYGTRLNITSQAKGEAEIIADKRRLVERLFDNLRHNMK